MEVNTALRETNGFRVCPLGKLRYLFRSVEHLEPSRALLFPLPALPPRCGTSVVALSDTYLRCRSGLIRIRVAVQPTCETSRFCLLFLLLLLHHLLFVPSIPRVRLPLRDTGRGPTAYGEMRLMRDAPPLPVTTTVFSFSPFPFPRLTSHVSPARSAHSAITRRDARRSRRTHGHGTHCRPSSTAIWRARIVHNRARTESMCTRAACTRLSVRSSVRPSTRSFLRPSVRPHVLPPSVVSRIGAARLPLAFTGVHDSRNRDHAHARPRSVTCSSEPPLPSARTQHTHVFHEKECPSSPSSTRE